MRPDRRKAERKGRLAEDVAAFFLQMKGYRIIARRFRSPVGEIDIIARRGATLAFVEVKARGTRDDALLAISPKARGRLLAAANAFVARHPGATGLTLRFDVVALSPFRLPHHLEDAFAEDR